MSPEDIITIVGIISVKYFAAPPYHSIYTNRVNSLCREGLKIHGPSVDRWKGGVGWGGNHSPFQMWPCAKLGRRRAVIWEGGGLWGWKVTAWTHIEWRRVDLLCAHDNEGESMTWWNTWLWGRCGNTMIWEAARHRSEKQTLGIEVKRQMGQEPGPDEDSHMWEAADVWSIIPSSGPLYTLLCVRAPWAPQSHIDKHYPNPFIYSFSLVRVGRRRGGL